MLARAPVQSAETVEPVDEASAEDETEQSLTQLLEQLGRQTTALAFYEARLGASRHERPRGHRERRPPLHPARLPSSVRATEGAGPS